MADVPDEAIDALARTLHDYEDTDDDEVTWEEYRPDAKDMLDVLAPILAAQVRRDLAEQLLTLADVKHPGYDPARFDAFLDEYRLVYHSRMRDTLKAAARQIGGDHA